MAMRRSHDIRMGKPVSLADAIGSFARENHLTARLQSASVVNAFMSMLPEKSRNAIQKADFSNGILRVNVQSAPLRSDLQMASASIMDMVNEKLQSDIVRKIILY